MTTIRQILSTTLIASTLVLTACETTPSAPAGPAVTKLGGRLGGAAEVPVVVTEAAGVVEVTYTPSTGVLLWNISYNKLSGPLKAAHFHGPALPGANAGVVVPITGNLESPISGSATITPAQAADLLAGKWYVNLHTAANPSGEARAQVVVKQ